MKKALKGSALVDIHLRLPADDLEKVKQLAARQRVPYQILLRQLLHGALKQFSPPTGFLIEP